MVKQFILGTQREVLEETGITLKETDLTFSSTFYISKPKIDYNLHVFYSKHSKFPEVTLSLEHSEYAWIPLTQVKEIHLIPGGLEVIQKTKIHYN